MKYTWLLMLTFALPPLASAGPCTVGTLANYVSLGSTGCTIGGDTVDLFTVLPGTTGGTELGPGVVSVTPSGGTANPTLTFGVNQSAGTNVQLETMFTYMISGPGFVADMITLSGSSETVDGAVTDIQNYCVDGSFGPDGVDGCTGSSTGALLTIDGVQNTDQTPLTALGFLSVTDDFELDGGTAGSATGGTFADQFTGQTSATPEPGSYFLVAAGLLLAGCLKFRFANRSVQVPEDHHV
jgi:hypothetical protein